MVFSTKILNLKLASPRSNQSAKNKQTFQSKIVLISLKLIFCVEIVSECCDYLLFLFLYCFKSLVNKVDFANVENGTFDNVDFFDIIKFC